MPLRAAAAKPPEMPATAWSAPKAPETMAASAPGMAPAWSTSTTIAMRAYRPAMSGAIHSAMRATIEMPPTTTGVARTMRATAVPQAGTPKVPSMTLEMALAWVAS